MTNKLVEILAEPFLLVQIGDYGGDLYDDMPLPKGLVPVAKMRERDSRRKYPKSRNLPPPGFRVPTDLNGILMLKMDELDAVGFAYWAQTLTTRVHPRACVNSGPDELVRFSEGAGAVNVVLVAKSVTSPPKGSHPGSVFERWTTKGFVKEAPTGGIDKSIVYTETGKSTLVFEELQALDVPHQHVDLNEFHVYFMKYTEAVKKGSRLPYRSSMYGTCSLLAKGRPDRGGNILPLRPESASRLVVATGRLHPHVCGRVRG